METTVIAQCPVDVSVGPVAWAVFADNGNIRIWSSASEPVRKLAEAEGLKLVPLYVIPDGWALVPKHETEAMHDAVMSVLYRGVARNRTQTLLDAYLSSAPVSPNAGGNQPPR